MPLEIAIENFLINLNSPTFIVAEIGQNHQGDLNHAKRLIKAAQNSGANCVKFQKTNLKEKFTQQALNRTYDGPNSWGKSYGEHKKHLEFSDDEFIELYEYARSLNVLFTASAMDLKSLQFLINIKVPFIKIGSGDANNFILIEEAAKSNIPLIISTGMQPFATVKTIHNLISNYHKRFIMLHCVSSYPTPIHEVNLKVIQLYKQEFPDIIIGYSGHELGIDISLAAVALGAKVIERHITLDKNQKGSDHKCSLLPEEFKVMVNKIRMLETAFGNPEKIVQPSEMDCYKKLGKSIVAKDDMLKNKKIELNDFTIKVAEPSGLDGAYLREIGEKILLKDIKKDESLTRAHLFYD